MSKSILPRHQSYTSNFPYAKQQPREMPSDSRGYDPMRSQTEYTSFVETSSHWIKAIPWPQFENLLQEYYRSEFSSMEFEFRIGKLSSKKFTSGVSEENWKSFLVSVSKQNWDSVSEWQLYRNLIFDNQERLTEIDNSNSIAKIIHKSKIMSPIDIALAGMYDLRIVLSKESIVSELHDLNSKISVVRFCKRQTMTKKTIFGNFDVFFTIIYEGYSKEDALDQEPIYEIEIELHLLPDFKEYKISFDEFKCKYKQVLMETLTLILDPFLNPLCYKKLAPKIVTSAENLLDPLHGIDSLLEFFTKGKAIVPFLQEKKEIDLISIMNVDKKQLDSFSLKFFTVPFGNDSAKRLFANSPLRNDLLANFETFFEEKSSFGALIQESRRTSHNNNASSNFRFPGSLPANLLETDLEMIRFSNTYRVLWKTNGVRGLIFLTCWKDPKSNATHRLCVFINRSLQMFSIAFETTNQNLFKGTIFDGELVCNKSKEFEFQIFDCLAFEGLNLRKASYDKRMVSMPQFFKSIKSCKTFEWKQKRLVGSLSELTMKPESYDTDGFILMDIARPYYIGQDQFLFKWKPLEQTTIDFYVTISASDMGPMIKLFLIDANRKFKQVLSFERNSRWYSIGNVSERIVECKMENGKWIPIHIRDDKPMPNNISTFERTLKGIHQNLLLRDWAFSSLFEKVGSLSE